MATEEATIQEIYEVAKSVCASYLKNIGRKETWVPAETVHHTAYAPVSANRRRGTPLLDGFEMALPLNRTDFNFKYPVELKDRFEVCDNAFMTGECTKAFFNVINRIESGKLSSHDACAYFVVRNMTRNAATDVDLSIVLQFAIETYSLGGKTVSPEDLSYLMFMLCDWFHVDGGWNIASNEDGMELQSSYLQYILTRYVDGDGRYTLEDAGSDSDVPAKNYAIPYYDPLFFGIMEEGFLNDAGLERAKEFLWRKCFRRSVRIPIRENDIAHLKEEGESIERRIKEAVEKCPHERFVLSAEADPASRTMMRMCVDCGYTEFDDGLALLRGKTCIGNMSLEEIGRLSTKIRVVARI